MQGWENVSEETKKSWQELGTNLGPSIEIDARYGKEMQNLPALLQLDDARQDLVWQWYFRVFIILVLRTILEVTSWDHTRTTHLMSVFCVGLFS
jgi:hypothetical protein